MWKGAYVGVYELLKVNDTSAFFWTKQRLHILF